MREPAISKSTMSKPVQSKPRVLISGASSGIGEALAGFYAQQGWAVVACGRNQQKLAELADIAEKTLWFDITDNKAVLAAAEQVASLDLLILNAGSCEYIDDAYHFDQALFSRVINTNLLAMGNMLAAFLPKLGSGTRLVFISSSATLLPFPRAQAYGASKAGVDYLANSMRLDLAAKGIGVSLVHPGFIKTPLTDKNDFAMPFMLSSEQAAKRIYAGVQAGKAYIAFPKRLIFLLKFFAVLPRSWWQRLIVRESNQ